MFKKNLRPNDLTVDRFKRPGAEWRRLKVLRQGRQPLQLGRVVRQFFWVFLPLSALVVAVSAELYRSEQNTSQTTIANREVHKIELQNATVIQELEPIVSDLRVLSSYREIKDLVAGKEFDKAALGTGLLDFARLKATYSAVRLLTPTGQGLVQVKLDGAKYAIVPESALQTAQKTPFEAGTTSEAGDILISPLELEREGNQLKRPFEAVIRLQAPLYDRQGELKAILQVRYRAERLRQKLRSAFAETGRVMMLNSEGYWLLSPNPEEEWGFLIPERRDRKFGQQFPEAWQQISLQRSGQFHTSQGLFTFTTVYPKLEQAASEVKNNSANNSADAWKIVSYVPIEVLDRRTNQLLDWLMPLNGGLIVLIGIVSGSMALMRSSRQRTQAELRQSTGQLREAERRDLLKSHITAQIRTSLDLDTILETAVAEIREVMQVDRCVFAWYVPRAEMPVWNVVKEAKLLQLASSLGEYSAALVGPLAKRVLDLEVLQIDEVAALEEPLLRQLLQTLGYKSFLGVPILTRPGEIGVVICGRNQRAQPWSTGEVELLRGVTDQLAIAINQAELYAESRSAAQALQASQEQLQAILDNSPAVIYVKDRQGRYQLVNRQFESLFGLSQSEVLGKTDQDLYPPEIAAALAENDRRVLDTGQPIQFEETVMEANQLRTYISAKFPLRSAGGQMETLCGISTDITDRIQAEAALSASEAQSRQKTQQLEQTLHELQETQTQLIQTEKMSSLGQLVAGVAHEINNPIGFIHGNLVHATNYIQDLLRLVDLYQSHIPQPPPVIAEEIEAMDLEFLTEDLTHLVKSMSVGTDRIREIVRSLRNFSRLDESEAKGVDIHEGIDSTLMILQSRLKSRGAQPAVTVIKHYGTLPLVHCFPSQLNQVLMNILANALDAMESHNETRSPDEIKQNPSQIEICTEVVEQWVQITIADNGAGMTEEVRSRLFDPFFTTKAIGKGTGLGLSISYQIIVEKHHGKLECQSELGKGAKFIIQIPA